MARRQVYGAVLAYCLAVAAGAHAQPALQPFSLHEGYEEQDPMQVWLSDGHNDVAFKGLTDEVAFEGRRSFKLDMTIRDGRRHYWHLPLRVPVPCEGKLGFSARLRVGEGNTASVCLGVQYLFPPTQHSGGGMYETFDKSTDGEWKLVTGDLVVDGRNSAKWAMAEVAPTVDGAQVGVVVDRVGLYILGEPGQRAVVYLDDVRVEGETPDPNTYIDEVQRRMEGARLAFAEQVAGWRAELDRGRAALAALPEYPAGEQALAGALSAADKLGSLLAGFATRPFATPAERLETDTALERLRSTAPFLTQIAWGSQQGTSCLVYVPPAITNRQITSDLFPVPEPLGSELTVAACRGEYESATFVLYALAPLAGVRLILTDLEGPGRIPAAAIEPYVVKCWYQAGRGIAHTDERLLVPELLLKDDRLVRVDLEKRENWLRSTTPDGTETYVPCSGPTSEQLENVRPVDARTLQPVDVPAQRVQQFWLTVHVPADAKPGTYRGAVKLEADGKREIELPLVLTVYPFELAASPLTYSLYYLGIPRPGNQPGSISADHKSEPQFEAEMRDCLAHGVPYPSLQLIAWQWFDQNDPMVPRALELRRQVGLPGGPLFLTNVALGNDTDPDALRDLQRRIKHLQELSAPSGYTDLHFYGIDEATGERLTSQRPAWQAAHEAGVKTYAACYKGAFERVGDLLDVAVLSGRPDPEEARKYHGVGHRVFCYAFPQVGPEEPETFRRNFGLVLWQAGFDGAMDFAYQFGAGHIWNDFDDTTLRDHVFAYPTEDGVVDTVQWEGFREAVDDVRYVTTLNGAIEQAPAEQAQTAARARAWLDELDPSGQLYETRAKMAEWIMALM